MNKHYLNILILSFLIIVLSFSVSAYEPFSMDDYYPITQGNTWTYSTMWGGYEGTEVVLINGTEIINSTETVKMYYYGDGYYGYDALAKTSNGLEQYKFYEEDEYWDETYYEIYSPPLLISPSHMGIGDKHTSSTGYTVYEDNDVWAGTATFNLTLLSEEILTVQAGTFQTLKFSYSDYWEDGDCYGNDEGMIWLASGVGTIKEIGNETEYCMLEDPYTYDYSIELMNATIDGISYPHLPTVSGYVFNSDNEPLANVPVELWNEDETIWFDTTTNLDGYFELDIPPGEYSIYVNMDGQILEGYTEAGIGEDTPMLDVTSDIEVNFTLWKIDVSLETDSSSYNKGDTIEVNVTVTNNEIFDIENWEIGADLFFENATDAGYLEDYYPVNISSGEKKSFLLYLEIPESAVYGTWDIWGWVWTDELEFSSSKGTLQGEIGKEIGKEISIITPDEQAIRDMYEALEIAYNAKDINTFMSYVSLDYFDGCEDYSAYWDFIQYEFDNYYDLDLNMEVVDINIQGDLAYVGDTGNWTGKRNSDDIIEEDFWFWDELILKKENDGWKWYGNQKQSWVEALVGNNVNPPEDHYFLTMIAESECYGTDLISANVTGPQIDTVVLDGDENFFIGFSEITPNIGDVYTFHLMYSDGYTEEADYSIKSLVASGPTITYPEHNSDIIETKPTFTWTDASSAVNNQGYYWIRLSDETDSIIWDIELPLTETSVQYDIDGLAEAPLESGKGYRFEVFIHDIYGDYAYQSTYFTISDILTFNLNLNEGWNLISSPLNFTNLTKAILPIQSDFESMFYFDAEYQEFTQIDPFNLDDEPDLTSGVWLKVSEDTTWHITGTEFASPVYITLYYGWNIMAWPSLEEELIRGTDLENDIIYTYNGTWSSYIPGRAFNSLTTFRPGYGYWIKSK